MPAALFAGLMSGTSMDGVDAVLCRFDDAHFGGVIDAAAHAYPSALREQLLHLQRDQPSLTLREFAELDNAVAEHFAHATQLLLREGGVQPSDIAAIGSHGQTVFHDPYGAHASLQLGNPSLIAARTGVCTVADFRRADVARCGHGAPLVPAFHHAVFAHATEARAVVNLGGIANVTLLPSDDAASVRGFDIGPGNALMDEWIATHRGAPFDAEGAWARAGSVHPPLLHALLADPYFAAAPPKSTGRGEFNLHWVRRCYPALNRLDPADVQRTFCELTAQTVADAITHHGAPTRRVLICGGGARNHLLCERLAALLGPRGLESTDAHGLANQCVEGAAFAWLAAQTLHGLPGNVPAVTGANAPAILGGIYRV